MFIVIGIMLSGLLLGYLLRNRARGVLELFSKGSMITVYALLFVMGLELGGNRAVSSNILAIGWEALLISVASTLGSVLAAWAIFRLFFSKTVTFSPDSSAALSPDSSAALSPDSSSVLCQESSCTPSHQSLSQSSFHLSGQSCSPPSPKSPRKSSPMTGSLAIVAAFLAGCLAGWASLKCLPSGFSITTFITDSKISSWLLYLLIAQVGLGVGSDPKLGSILRNARPHILLLPAATIAGTLLFSLLVSAVISRWSPSEVIAVGSGFGYYSLSSILITTLKEASIGVQAAAELGTLALIANILREMMTLIFAPVLAKVFGPAAPIAAGGATTMDVTLPVISRASGDKWIVASMIHGFLVDFSVPWIVPFFCSL